MKLPEPIWENVMRKTEFPGFHETSVESFKNGYFFILPAFYKAILWLKKQKWRFKIVFWTMGREIPIVTQEFNQFCEGNHPAFNGENGTHKVLFNESKGPNLKV